jgi:hypothetical protein
MSSTRRSGHRIVGDFWDFGGMLRHRQHQRTVDAQHGVAVIHQYQVIIHGGDTATGMENGWRCAAMAGGPNRFSLLSSPATSPWVMRRLKFGGERRGLADRGISP